MPKFPTARTHFWNSKETGLMFISWCIVSYNFVSYYIWLRIFWGGSRLAITSIFSVAGDEAPHFILHETREQSKSIIMFPTNKVAVFDAMFSKVFILIPPAPETKWGVLRQDSPNLVHQIHKEMARRITFNLPLSILLILYGNVFEDHSNSRWYHSSDTQNNNGECVREVYCYTPVKSQIPKQRTTPSSSLSIDNYTGRLLLDVPHN